LTLPCEMRLEKEKKWNLSHLYNIIGRKPNNEKFPNPHTLKTIKIKPHPNPKKLKTWVKSEHSLNLQKEKN
jgi:hypothetical protein